jgi:hypothetical protein
MLTEIERRERFAATVSRLSEWEKSRLLRFALRLANHDKKAERLAALHEAGKITRRDLLSRI